MELHLGEDQFAVGGSAQRALVTDRIRAPQTNARNRPVECSSGAQGFAPEPELLLVMERYIRRAHAKLKVAK